MLRDDSGDERDGDGRTGADQGRGVVAGDEQHHERGDEEGRQPDQNFGAHAFSVPGTQRRSWRMTTRGNPPDTASVVPANVNPAASNSARVPT